MQSKYYDRFAAYRSAQEAEQIKLLGNRLYLELLEEKEMKSKGGILLAESEDQRSDFKANKAAYCIVLAVGEGYRNDEGEVTEPCVVKSGQVVQIAKESLTKITRMGTLVDPTIGPIYRASETDVYEIIPDLEDYQDVICAEEKNLQS